MWRPPNPVLVAVAVGGAAGAATRYGLGLVFPDPVGTGFPWTTFGLAAGAGGLPAWVRVLAGTGFCGALTTYSTFGLETVRLAEVGAWRNASINTGATVVAGLGACWLGWLMSS